MKKRYLLLGLGLLAVGYLLTGWKSIPPGERAVVRRFGRVVATPAPGLWMGLPWGLDRVDRISIQLRRVTVGFQFDEEDDLTVPRGQLLTGDHNLVNVQVMVDYAVDESRLEDFLEQENRVEGVVARTAEAVLAEWVAGRSVDDVLMRGQAELPLWLVRLTQERIQNYHLGVRIQSANVSHLLPPQQVKADFDEVTRAQTSIQTQSNEALQKRVEILRQAEKISFEIDRATDSYVAERVRLAQADADRFEQRLEKFHQLRKDNPDYLAAIWWEEMSKLFSRLKENGAIDLLDNHLSPDGLDITVFPPMPKKK
jgi:modulator of FtsH protease HflK